MLSIIVLTGSVILLLMIIVALVTAKRYPEPAHLQSILDQRQERERAKYRR